MLGCQYPTDVKQKTLVTHVDEVSVEGVTKLGSRMPTGPPYFGREAHLSTWPMAGVIWRARPYEVRPGLKNYDPVSSYRGLTDTRDVLAETPARVAEPLL